MQTQIANKEIYSQLIKSAEHIGQLAEQEVLIAEQNCTISKNVVNAIVDAGINRLIIPKEYGYPQIDFPTFSDLIKKIGYYNLSAAWVTYFYALHNAWVALLPKHRMDEIYAHGGLLTDIFAPVGRLEETEGGVILNGKWNFVSGIKYSDWVAVGALRFTPDSDMPLHFLLALKVEDVEIVEDWDSLGLRGSGSHTIIVKDLFVPSDMLIDLSEVTVNRRPKNLEISEDYLYFNKPYFPAFFIGFPSMAVGAAERIVDEFVQRAKNRIRFDGTNEGQSPSSQRVAGELKMKLKAVQSLLRDYVEMLAEDAGQHDNAEYNMIRVHIIKECVEIAVRATSSIGASGLKRGSVLEVMTRDLITISTHITSLYEDGISNFGKFMFDVPNNSRG
ncbi:acyl-CoA dehydrogenase family protein [Planococcus shenhongbingii]|uniref:acyl-CoA dehydrogenase family protein n=1 Tax=Planococcus shenhongbingii TaxID=3058398 RepID=UPI002629511C|nr:acyl-CoA dehydrogenase family protein [Planococcus sp. N016]WKA58263.1 acyl-CoA dehydrogenase family protein [Planococcus sp. N016]